MLLQLLNRQKKPPKNRGTDLALGEFELFADVEDFGRERNDGLQKGFPMYHDPGAQHTKKNALKDHI